MGPLRLKPVYKNTIWASDRLCQIRGLPDPQIGIARETCAYRGSENIVESGPFEGMLLSDLIREHHEELLGSDPADQVLRTAYMGSKEDLSIQVHPNARQAEAIGDYEKTEAWYVLEAEPGARITAGIDLEDKDLIRQAVENNELEKHLIRFPVQPGDFVLIPANLIHANGGGMLVLEVGTFGGITYRLYDYGRPRKLNVEEALAIMNPSLRTTVTHHPLPSKAMNQWDQGINCDRFTVDILDVAEMAPLEQRPYYYILSCVNNECDVLTEDGVFHLDYTQTLMIPASYGFLQIRGKCRVLVSHVRY